VRNRLSIICFCLVLWGASELRSQTPGEFVLAARRTGAVEILDGVTLQTVRQIHFDLHVERLSASPDGTALYVDGYGSGGCCRHFALDLATVILTEIPAATVGRRSPDSFGNIQISPDGRWRFELKSFRGPALRTIDLSSGVVVDLAPSALPLTEEACGGNWYAQGAWSGERFYFYVACPNHPGFLWTVSPGAHELGGGVPVVSFAVNSACRPSQPVFKTLAAAAGKLFLYESFGSKSDRTGGCTTALPGGAWILDPATGQLRGRLRPACISTGWSLTARDRCFMASIREMLPGEGRCASSQSTVRITASSSRGPSTLEFCTFLPVCCAVCLRAMCAWRRRRIDNCRGQLNGQRLLSSWRSRPQRPVADNSLRTAVYRLHRDISQSPALIGFFCDECGTAVLGRKPHSVRFPLEVLPAW
jgi:hypothetical protein